MTRHALRSCRHVYLLLIPSAAIFCLALFLFQTYAWSKLVNIQQNISPAQSATTALRVPDFDEDIDVDQADFAILQRCYSGQQQKDLPSACNITDLDGDADVDQYDLALFELCASAPGVPYDESCTNQPVEDMVPDYAFNPNPPDQAVGINPETTSSWSSGTAATSHDVYFGTTDPPPFVGNQSETLYDPESLDDNTTYYWRINERNDLGVNTGKVWSFTTGPILLEEGFENGLGEWEKGADVPEDPTNPGHPMPWSIQQSDEQSFDGVYSARYFLDGHQDDGTIWLMQALTVEPTTTYPVQLSIEFWSPTESFNTIALVAMYLGNEPPTMEEDFDTSQPANLVAGWKTYKLQANATSDMNGKIWVAFGISAVWESDMTYYIDHVRVEKVTGNDPGPLKQNQ